MKHLSLLVVLAALLASAPGSAAADEVAPALAASDLRTRAEMALRIILTTLPEHERARLRGIYVAFHPDAADPFALAACDDDGDYVIVITDAMLRLLASIARTQSSGDDDSRTIESYASFLARTQVPGARLLPLPAGSRMADAYEDRLGESLAFVVARELAHARAGAIVCPRPTPTKEAGDDIWTTAEHRRALDRRSSIYPSRGDADAEAAERVRDAGLLELGGRGLLRFFAQLEIEQRAGAWRFAPTYLSLYPGAAGRAARLPSKR